CTGQPSVCTLNAGATGSTTCQPDNDSASLTALQDALAAAPEWAAVLQVQATSLGMNTTDFSNRLACNEGGPTTEWIVFLSGSTTDGMLTVLPENTTYRMMLFWAVGADKYWANVLSIIHQNGTNAPELLKLDGTPVSSLPRWLERVLDLFGPTSAYAYIADCGAAESEWLTCAKGTASSAMSTITDVSSCYEARKCAAIPNPALKAACYAGTLWECNKTHEDQSKTSEGLSCLKTKWPVGVECLVPAFCDLGTCSFTASPHSIQASDCGAGGCGPTDFRVGWDPFCDTCGFAWSHSVTGCAMAVGPPPSYAPTKPLFTGPTGAGTIDPLVSQQCGTPCDWYFTCGCGLPTGGPYCGTGIT